MNTIKQCIGRVLLFLVPIFIFSCIIDRYIYEIIYQEFPPGVSLSAFVILYVAKYTFLYNFLFLLLISALVRGKITFKIEIFEFLFYFLLHILLCFLY